MARESYIRVLRSTTTDTPTGLTYGELAFSDLNNKFFVGDNSGNSLWIGAEVTSGDLSNNSAYMVSTQSSVKAYVDGIVGGGSVVNSVNGTGGNITITGSGAITTTVSGTTTTFGARLASTSVTGVASFSSSYFTVNGAGSVTIADDAIANKNIVNPFIYVGDNTGGTAYVDLGKTLSLTGGSGIYTAKTSPWSVGDAQIKIFNTGVLSVNGSTGNYVLPLASSSVTGVASFNSTYFSVNGSGAVSLATAYQATGDTVSAGSFIGVTRSGNSVTVNNLGVHSINGLTGVYTIPVASTSVTGFASFSSDNFAVNGSGQVTIKDGGVVNDELANPFILVRNDTGATGDVKLGNTLTITGNQGLDITLGKATGNVTVTLANTGVLSVNGSTGNYALPLASTSVTGVASFNDSYFSVDGNGKVALVAAYQVTGDTVSAGSFIGVTRSGNSVTVNNTGVHSINGTTGAYVVPVASTSVTGFASFSSTNFAVDGNGLVTIKNGGVENAELVNSTINFTDGSSSSGVALGGTLTITGSANEILVSQSSGTYTIGLPDDVVIAGNLTVNGSVVTANVDTIVVEDPLIMLGTGNAADSVDLGFYAKFTSGVAKYSGLFRDASDGKFKLFTDLQSEPTTTVNTAGTGYSIATLVVNIDGGTF